MLTQLDQHIAFWFPAGFLAWTYLSNNDDHKSVARRCFQRYLTNLETYNA